MNIVSFTSLHVLSYCRHGNWKISGQYSKGISYFCYLIIINLIQQATAPRVPPKVTTSLAISSTKTRADHDPVKSTETAKPSKEPVKTTAELSQNRYVMQMLQNMPPPVTCDYKVEDQDDVELEGLTPTQARVLQAQQRRVWRSKKESELNDALSKAQAAIEAAEEKEHSSNITTIKVTHQQQNDN